MPVKPKISAEMSETLRNAYINQKMSTTEISNRSEELFGIKISAGTIYKEIVRYNIPLRTKSQSISMAKSTLDASQIWMNESKIEWVDGLMLGDGYINFKKDINFMGARFRLDSSCKEWTIYGMSELKEYQTDEPKTYNQIDEKHPNPIWMSQTLTHPEIVIQARRWYPDPDYKKKVPKDVRITPTSVMLWYLGDGSFHYEEEGNIAALRLATCGFLEEDIKNILMPKLAEVGIRSGYVNGKNDIRIDSDSIKDFFNFIGYQSPIKCYEYKFNIPEWLKLIRLSEIVTNDKELWRAQYYCKNGKVEHSRSPGGKFFLFTKDQASKLKEVISQKEEIVEKSWLKYYQK